MDSTASQVSLRSIDIPVPPEDVRYRIASAPIDEATFLRSGMECASDILRILDGAGVNAGNFRSILDFGCGCSRVLRYLHPHFARARFHGWDVDQVAIEWNRQHIAAVQYDVVPHLPPTPCPRGLFDFIYGLSVFSHLDLPRQLLWLEELHQILRPEGLLLLTVHGQFAHNLVKDEITEQEKQEFEATGFLYISNISDKVMPDWYQTAIYKENFARLVFGAKFSILRFQPRGMGGCQDLLLLKKRSLPAMTAAESSPA